MALGLWAASGCADEVVQTHVVLHPGAADAQGNARVDHYGDLLDCDDQVSMEMGTVNVGGIALVGELEARMKALPGALMSVAESLDLQVVALQELYEDSHRSALREELASHGWTLVSDERASHTGLALAVGALELVGEPVSVELPVEPRRFGYQRGLLCQELSTGEVGLFVCTSHYASMHSKSARDTREEQFVATSETVEQLGSVVLLADFNVSTGFIPRGRWIPRWEFRDAEQLARFVRRSQPRALGTGTTFGTFVNPRGDNSTAWGEGAFLGRELDAGVAYGDTDLRSASVVPLKADDGEFVTDHNLLRVDVSLCREGRSPDPMLSMRAEGGRA